MRLKHTWKRADGVIYPGDAPEEWGFTRANFTSGDFGSYLWKSGDRITISVIMAKHRGRGDFSRLVKAIEADGFDVAVPTPLAQMRAILQRWGFVSTEEDFEDQFGRKTGAKVEMMVRPKKGTP